MKPRLKQMVSMLLISMMLVSLFPSGAWAEDGTQGNAGKNWFQEIVSTLTAKWGQEKTNPLPERAADQLDLTAESQQPAAGQNIQTTAVEGDYEYAVVEGSVTITQYKGAGGDVAIPATLGGLSVSKIGGGAFNFCRSLTSISLPESLISIDEGNPFHGCTSLMNITVATNNANYESISGVLYNKTKTILIACPGGAMSISLPGSLTSIGHGAFDGCRSLTSISLPEGLTSIGSVAFSYCSSLTSISLPGSLTSIGDWAFNECSSLTSISLPESLTSIGDGAFAYCSSLTSISLPGSLTSIGNATFYKCRSLTSIRLPESLTSIGDSTFSGCSSLTSISLPEGLTSTGNSAFDFCSSLTSISLPESLTSIGGSTFSGCSSLTNISLPGSLTSIGGSTFSGCSSLTSISLPEGLTSTGGSTFSGCSSLTSISLPESLTSIGDWAFYDCSSLTSISLPEGLTSIGYYTFYDCSSLTSINLPEGLTSIGFYAFRECRSLKSIQFNSAKTTIGGESDTIPRTTTIIAYDPSTAKDYATEFGNPFQLIGSSSGGDDSTSVSTTAQVIAVRDYATKQPVTGVSVVLAGKTLTTDSSGFATFENSATGNQNLSLYASGYCDYETGLKVSLGTVEVFYLRKDTEPNKPYVSMINLNDGSKTFDLFRQSKSFKEHTSDAGITDADKATITMKANWKGKTAKSYRLTQNGSTIMESTTGTFDKKALGRLFKPGYKIYALVVAGDGTVSNAVETGIQITSATSYWELHDSASEEMNLGKSLGVTIPDNLPIVGGSYVNLGTKLKTNISVTPDRFKIAIGVESSKIVFDEKWSDFKKSVDDAIGTTNSDRYLKDLQETYSGKTTIVPVIPGFGFNGESNNVGYIEGIICDGQPVVTRGKIILNSSGSFSKQIPFAPAPPVVLEVGGGLEMELMGEIARVIPESGEVKLTTELTITPSFELGGGAGIPDFVTVVASGKGEMPFLNRFSDDYYKVSFTGSMSIKSTVLFLESKTEIAKHTWTIAEGYGNFGSVEANVLENEADSFNIYDPNQYRLMPRDYAQNPITWGGEQPLMSAQSADYTNQTLSVLQTNLFPNAQPKMATIGDQQVMVWIADNTSRSSANRTMMVYSVYNPTTKTWSEPVAVADDSTADFYPQIASDGTSLYVTWQNSRTTFADTVTLTEAAKAGEIAVAKYNPTTKVFDAAVTLTDNDTLDTQPQIAVSGDKAGVVWSSNSVNDLFGTTGRNTIQSAALNGTAWTVAQDLVADQNAITALAAGYTGTTLSAAYTVDGDNDLNTITDRELFAAKPGQNATRLTNDDTLDSNPVFASMNGSDSLFWYHDGNIVYTPAANLGTTPATVFAETRQGFGDIFSIVNNPAGKTAVIWTETSNEMTEIHGAIYDKSKNQWSDDIQISNLGNRVQFPNGIFDDSGNFNIAFNRLTIREDLSEQSDLCIVNVVPAYNLTLDNVSYSDDAVIPKTALPIEVEVTNNGQLPVDRITVDVTDGGTINTSTTITESIKPGETKTINTTINLPETITKKDYTVSIKPAIGDEYNGSDNSKTITLGYTDLALAIEKNSVGDTASMTVQVSNLSYVPTNATLKVTEDSADGKVLLTKDLANLTKGTNMVEIVELDPKTMTFAGDKKQIYVTITVTGTEELSTGDNSDFIVVDNPTPTVDPGDPTASGLVAFLGKDPGGTYLEYNAADLNNAYLAYQINPGMATAKMYQQFLSSKCRVIGLKDKGKGYMDYNAAATASLMAQMKGEAFDINAYFASSEAGKLAETVENLKIVDKDGNVS